MLRTRFSKLYRSNQWLKQELGIKTACKTVYQLVRYKLGAKLKVPRPKSRKQHPESQSHLKKTSFSSQILARRIRSW